MKLNEIQDLYPERDIQYDYIDAKKYCRWIASRPWWQSSVVINEGGWASFFQTALLYGLNGETFREGLEEYGRILIKNYRMDTELVYPDGWDSKDYSEASDSVTLKSYAPRDIVPLVEVAPELGAAAQRKQSLHTNVLTDILCPPFSDDAVDALTLWANTRSYQEAASYADCEWKEIRQLVKQVQLMASRYDDIESALNRSRNPNAHKRWHKDEPSRWCWWCKDIAV